MPKPLKASSKVHLMSRRDELQRGLDLLDGRTIVKADMEWSGDGDPLPGSEGGADRIVLTLDNGRKVAFRGVELQDGAWVEIEPQSEVEGS